MFDRYTEQARNAIFHARYEASQAGLEEITPEHLLLGLLQVQKGWQHLLFGSGGTLETLRGKFVRREPAGRSTSVDMPLSNICRRVLVFGAEESKKMGHAHVGPEHLLVGIVREQCPAAELLRDRGFDLAKLRSALCCEATPAPEEEAEPALLVGRERELARAIQILHRRTRNHVALIGEPGVGKTAIMRALAERIADRPVVKLDAGDLIASRRREDFPGDALLCIEGLFDLAAHRSAWAALQGSHILEPHLTGGAMRCVATGTPAGFRQTVEHAGMLSQHFEVVEVAPPDEEETLRVLAALKPQYEKFHGVTYAEDTLEAAVYASSRFLSHRFLPDRALDLVDEAGARVKLRQESGRTVTADDIVAVVADRAGVSVEAVKSALGQRGTRELRQIIEMLAGQVGADGHEWLPLLAAYLLRSTEEEAAALAEAIRRAKGPVPPAPGREH
jgi:ATP-dependent Clp protease ATP-binding subunit ClpC